MSLRRGQATQRKPAQKKAGNRQGNSSSRKQSKGPVNGGQARSSVRMAPVAIGNTTRQRKPVMQSRGENMTVRHSEYVKDITGSTSIFDVSSNTSLPINPGQGSAFPWLSAIAARFESYRFRKCNYRFVTESATSATGYVALIPDFDPTDSAPANKANAMQYQSAAKCAPWENMVCPFSREDISKRQTYFTRPSAVLANENLGLYDVGNLFIAVGGQASAATIGELWCDYEVEFMTPQIDTQQAAVSQKIVGATSQTGARPFGTAPVSTNSQFAYGTIAGDASNTFTFTSAFSGLLEIDQVGTVISALPAANGTATTFTSLKGVIDSGALNSSQTILIVASAGQMITLGGGTATTITTANARFAPYATALG